MTSAYEKSDRRRLAPSRARVAGLMLDGQWRSPYQIAEALGIRNPGTVASHLRDLKASGIYDLTRQRTAQPGVHEYKLTLHKPEQLPLLEATA